MFIRSFILASVSSLAFATSAWAERGADGHVSVLYWQAPSTLNPYLSGGTKDVEASSLILEPLARFDDKGKMLPWLATELPSKENGGIAEDNTSITWTLRPGLKWSDGTPVTADDVVFTWSYCMAPGGGCAQTPKFQGISNVEALNPSTVKITFAGPKPNPFDAFVGAQSPILQKAQFAACMGEAAPTCSDQNFHPIGTGPFRVTEFKTNDVLTLEANQHYRDGAKPRFASMTLKGGGDAESAARAVLETGEFDYAWNLTLAPELIEKMKGAGKGQTVTAFGTLVERIEVNLSDPSPNLPEGERSTLMHANPLLSDLQVRQALSMAIDRSLLAEVGFGKAGRPTCDAVPGPELYAANNTSCLTQDIEGAKALLEQAGWKLGPDGVRVKEGRRLSLSFLTSTNAIRQDFQSMIKQWWAQIGVETELKAVPASVLFGGDPASPDTFQKFYADVMMYATNFDGTDPESYLAVYTCDKIPSPATQWQGGNVNRICDRGYEDMIKELSQTSDPQMRRELAIKMNNYVTVDNHIFIALVDRGRVSAHANSLGGVKVNTWDSELWNVADWYRIE